MTRDDLIDWVSAKIDQVMPGGENAQGAIIDQAPIGYLEQELDNAAAYILKLAPDEFVNAIAVTGALHSPGTAIDSRLIIRADGSGLFVLPTDFVRFVSFKLASWRKSITELMEFKDPKYNLQFNAFRRGTRINPIGVYTPFTDYVANEIIVDVPNVNYAIEWFSTENQADTVEYFRYIPRIAAEDAPTDLLDPIAWETASRVLDILNRQNEAKNAHERGMRQISQFKVGQYGDRLK